MIILKKFGCDNKQLSPYLSCVAFILPVITKRPMTFGLEIALYMEQKGQLQLLAWFMIEILVKPGTEFSHWAFTELIYRFAHT